jgi:predicted MFS family arabinose efflux permease
MIVGIILMCLLSKRDEKGNNAPTHSSFGAMMKYIVAPLKDRRMILIIPLIAYSGLQQAFVWAVFTKNIVTPVLGISGVGGAMAIYGAADVVCSLVAGRLTSGLHSATSIVSVGAILQAVVLFWLLLFYRFGFVNRHCAVTPFFCSYACHWYHSELIFLLPTVQWVDCLVQQFHCL